MQVLAMITMLIDHLGVIFFKGDAWRIIGRLAFPLYAYGIVQGYLRTRSLKKYVLRLSLLAAVSQFPFMYALDKLQFNVLVTFVLSLFVLVAVDRVPFMWARVGIGAAGVVLMEIIPMDYGSYALLLILVFRFVPVDGLLLTHFVLNLAFWGFKGWELQLYSLAATFLINYPQLIRRLSEVRVPRWFWRGFYPAHLAALAMLRYLV
ncbi:TraX family protein [Paenibacillus koleovorans]|uniref:TraX family protein n=1 Tax=Paenibacillus koleovorans TaxID=121608 RepID=UPI000FDA1A73|nr:TraX family protein [Paenibacillus koleovorans]